VAVGEYIVSGQPGDNAATVFQMVELVDTTGTTGTIETTGTTWSTLTDDDNGVMVRLVVVSLVVLAILAALVGLLLFKAKSSKDHNADNSISVTLISPSTEDMNSPER
jgi:hypothetical protein